MKIKISALLLIASTLIASAFLFPTNPAPMVQLAWSPSAAFGVTNYQVYYGVGSRQYTTKVSAGTSTNFNLVLPARGVAFFFAVTCQDIGGLESDFSNEVNYTAPNPPTPPVQKPIVVLTVQTKGSSGGGWVDAGMYWSLSQDAASRFYRLEMDKYPAQLVAAASKAPPVPWAK